MALIDILSAQQLFGNLFDLLDAVVVADDCYAADLIGVNLSFLKVLAELTQLLDTNLSAFFLSFASFMYETKAF